MLATASNLLGAISWAPEIRNIVSVIVGFLVLCGSVYLLMATNLGIRTGLLVALCGLFGWMFLMGISWWLYGIGLLGRSPIWHVEEVNYSPPDYSGLAEANLDEARDLTALDELPTAQDLLADSPELVDEILPPDLEEDVRAARALTITLGQIIEARPELAEDLNEALSGWRLLPQSDRTRGDAVASSDAFLGPDGRALFESASDYVVLDVYRVGGKPDRSSDSMLGRIAHKISTMVNFQHPTRYAVVQVRAAVPQELVPGEAPPPPAIDEDAPVISVILVRDLGDKRFPAFMTTLIFGILFALTANTLHRRDKAVARARAAAA